MQTGEDVSNCVFDLIEKNPDKWFRITYDIKKHKNGILESANFEITELSEATDGESK